MGHAPGKVWWANPGVTLCWYVWY